MRTRVVLTRFAPLCAALLLALSALAADAQDTTGVGAVRGGVTDPGQQPVRDVAVRLVEGSRCAVTDAQGVFALVGVGADRCQLEVAAPGRPRLSSTVDVRAGLATIEVTLPDSGDLQETVTVSAPLFVARMHCFNPHADQRF